MKIAFFHELSFGGARRVIEEFGKRLKSNNFIDLYYIDEKEDRKITPIFTKLFFYRFTERKWHGSNWEVRLYKDTIELFFLYRLHKKIAEEIDKKAYDFVFIHPSKFTQAPFLLRFLRTPTVYFCEEPLRIVYDEFVSNISSLLITDRIYEKINRTFRKWIDKTNIKKADLILANSEFSKQWIKKAYNRNSSICYLGVNENKFRPLSVPKEYDVLFFGEKEVIEGYDLFRSSLRLFKVKPKVKIISRGKDGVEIPDEQLAIEYNKAKIVVALSKNEPFGLIPLESMACGVPVVAVNEGGFRESVINGVTGFLVKRDPKCLCFVIERILKDDKLRFEMGRQAREHILLNWTWEKSILRFLEIIEKWINKM